MDDLLLSRLVVLGAAEPDDVTDWSSASVPAHLRVRSDSPNGSVGISRWRQRLAEFVADDVPDRSLLSFCSSSRFCSGVCVPQRCAWLRMLPVGETQDPRPTDSVPGFFGQQYSVAALSGIGRVLRKSRIRVDVSVSLTGMEARVSHCCPPLISIRLSYHDIVMRYKFSWLTTRAFTPRRHPA